MWQERNARGVTGEPPCAGCLVELNTDNYIAARIFRLVQSQVRLYFDGERNREMDLDQVALWNIIDHYPHVIPNKWSLFEKVLGVYRFFITERDDANR